METKKLLVPVKLEFIPKIQARGQIRTFFEKNHLGPEIVRVNFLENRCIVRIDKPVLEYSPCKRLQFHLETRATKYDIIPRNRSEIAEA
jgi:hypothetical protein